MSELSVQQVIQQKSALLDSEVGVFGKIKYDEAQNHFSVFNVDNPDMMLRLEINETAFTFIDYSYIRHLGESPDRYVDSVIYGNLVEDNNNQTLSLHPKQITVRHAFSHVHVFANLSSFAAITQLDNYLSMSYVLDSVSVFVNKVVKLRGVFIGVPSSTSNDLFEIDAFIIDDLEILRSKQQINPVRSVRIEDKRFLKQFTKLVSPNIGGDFAYENPILIKALLNKHISQQIPLYLSDVTETIVQRSETRFVQWNKESIEINSTA